MNPKSRWIPPVEPNADWRLFYDGECALCHGFVSFVLKRDRRAVPIRFGPLQGETFRELSREVPLSAPLPDSILLSRPDGGVRFRSSAVLDLFGALGGIWRPLAAVLRIVPRPLADWFYDRVASVRKRIFGTTEEACPRVPAEWSRRFLP